MKADIGARCRIEGPGTRLPSLEADLAALDVIKSEVTLLRTLLLHFLPEHLYDQQFQLQKL